MSARVVLCFFALAALVPVGARAAAKAPAPAPQPTPSNGKRVVAIAPIRNVEILMPDEKLHDFGTDFYAALTGALTNSGDYIVVDPDAQDSGLHPYIQSQVVAPDLPIYHWTGTFVPAATITIRVDALNFRTGSHGEGMFYGFDERFRTPFNDGYGTFPNEFPLRPAGMGASWFGHAFDDKGVTPFDSRSGLDLGDGFHLDALFAWLTVKYALYHSELNLSIEVAAPLAGREEYRLVQVSGDGYFFDVVGAYDGYSAGIQVARSDAMGQAMSNALTAAQSAIGRALAGLPLTARIDNVLPDGTLLLGTGANSGVVSGTVYEAPDAPGLLVEVLGSNDSGSVGQVAGGDPSLAQPGLILREQTAGIGPPPAGGAGPGPVSVAATVPGRARVAAVASADTATGGVSTGDPITLNETITLPWTNLPKSDLGNLVPPDSVWIAFLKEIAEEIFLPYRIYRYFMYDRALKAHADLGESLASWEKDAAKQAWAKQIGFTPEPAPSGQPGSGLGPIVAVIDSGVDYNHPILYGSLWLNPAPTSDPEGRSDRYGWDFMAGDSRPADDAYHGTELASLVLAVAPDARIMALKAFNPYGVTSSAALFGAFQYAADRGASVILCGWATEVDSQALRFGVEYATEKGVPVVVAAGDGGWDLSKTPVFPASLARDHDGMIAVAAVDGKDARLASSNFDPGTLAIAAPGDSIRVAEPRGGHSRLSGSAAAAAFVAGALARLPATGTPSERLAALLSAAEPVTDLTGVVAGGRRLQLR